jgi:cytochrome c oxidase subunit 6a
VAAPPERLKCRRITETRTDESYSGVIPCLFLAAGNAYYLWNAHWDHWSHMPPLEERTQYPYQNIRTKNFPWGDGDKVRREELEPCRMQ